MSESVVRFLLTLSYCAPADGNALACYVGKGALLALLAFLILLAMAFSIAHGLRLLGRQAPRPGDLVAGVIGGLLGLKIGFGLIGHIPRDLYLPPLCLALGSLFAILGAEALRRRARGGDA